MSGLTVQELEAVAAAYEELLVPAVLQIWTKPMMESAAIGPGQRVLDVACGTGVLARMIATQVVPSGSVAGLDVNPGMLSTAARIAPHIEWRQGIAESLPWADRSFDAVVSQFGIMFFTDREAALREMLRVLVPGGRLAVAVFDSLENNPAYAAMAAVLERSAGTMAADALRLPFGLGDISQLETLFMAAAVPTPAIKTLKATGHFASVTDMVLADVKGWFPLAQIKLETSTLRAVITGAEAELKPFMSPHGAIEFPMSVCIATVMKE